MSTNYTGLVALHIGAGYHSPVNSNLYKSICRDACMKAMAVLNLGGTALDAAQAAIIALEDSPYTNAGTGSNLTVNGTVECDASIMDGMSLHFGAVGAVSDVKNPILVADDLLRTQMQGEMSLGRIPPSILVGVGASEWAAKKNIPTIHQDHLVTDQSRRSYLKNKRKLELFEEGRTASGQTTKMPRLKSPIKVSEKTNGKTEDVLQDTVGAICVDASGSVVSAVSSGGIILKQPGRLGQAAIFGGGCWAENDTEGHTGVGVSTSGCGEHLTRTFLARECAQCLKQQEDHLSAMNTVFNDKFLKSPFLRHVAQPLGGALSVSVDSSDPQRLDVEVLWGHTTDSMCLAFMSSQDSHPKALISRLPEGTAAGTKTVLQSKFISLKIS